MISITELWCNKSDRNSSLRYAKPKDILSVKPVVVWNSTERCNLKCKHCYSSSEDRSYSSELTTSEAMKLISDLKKFKIPCLLISGGEPLLRPDIFDLLEYAKKLELPTALSTNGTLLDDKTAQRLAQSSTRYIGISLDGIGEVNDRFRGITGAFAKTVKAFDYLQKHHINSGLRFMLSKQNLASLQEILQFIEDHEIKRVCFYHVVPVGRALNSNLTPSNDEIRKAMDVIMEWSEIMISNDKDIEVLTVDNHADAIYLLLRQRMKGKRQDNLGASLIQKIQNNGGAQFSSGVGIACIDATGNVHPDQFWKNCILGNVLQNNIKDIWTNTENSVLSMLRNRLNLIEGRCSKCKWLKLCGGGLRSRAHAVTDNPWASDPGCYLTDEEICT